VGLKVVLAEPDGAMVANPRPYRWEQKRLARAQHTSDQVTKGSHRRRKAQREVAKQHLTFARQRRDIHSKIAKHYAERCRYVCVEDLKVAGMMRNHQLAKSVHDASWSAFLGIVEDKAERATHQVIRVPARYTTQRYNRCGAYVQKGLSVRTHICLSCGLIDNRDVNAAKNVLQVGMQLVRAGAPPFGTGANGLPGGLRSPALEGWGVVTRHSMPPA
jgi:putative transposase